jgi:multidrug efflux system outer membrane protein
MGTGVLAACSPPPSSPPSSCPCSSSGWALRSHEAQLEVTRQALESRQQSLKIVQARVDGGTASGLDLAQAESALSAAQGQWSQVKRQRALSENQIGLLTGSPA